MKNWLFYILLMLCVGEMSYAGHAPRFRRHELYLPKPAGGFTDPNEAFLAFWLAMIPADTNAVDPVLPDSSGFNKDGIVHLGTANEPSIVPAGNGTNITSYSFDGVLAFIEATNSKTYFNGATALSLAVWCKPNVFGSNDGILGAKNSANTTGFGINEGGGASPLDQNIGAVFKASGGTGSFQSANKELVAGQWNFLVTTWRGSDGRVQAYHDGSNVINQATSAATGTLLHTARVELGHEGSVAIGTRMFDGEIGPPKIYLNLEMSAADVLTLFQRTGPDGDENPP